jgi:tetratricopeptide (TPR) repeat protein
MNPRWIGPALAAVTLLGCASVSQPQFSSRAPRHDGIKVAALASQTAQLRAKQLNAQALQLAQSGDVQEALRLWEQALSLDPYAARVHNNRGYALMLLGNLDEARVSLNLALAINPPSPQAGANLAMLARLQRQAELAAVSRDLGIAPANMPKQDQPSEVVISDTSPQLVVIGPQIYELRDAPVQVRTPPSVSPFGGQEAALAAIKAARLEVSNGVGVRLLAKRTSLKLAEQGVVTQRLTNTAGFAQASTELQFSPSHAAAAQALQAMLPAGAALQPLPRLDHLRLVLGHDLAGRAVLAWLEAPSAVAQTTPADHVSESSARWALVQDGWQWL